MKQFFAFVLFVLTLVACVGPSHQYSRYEANAVPDPTSFMPEIIPVWIDKDFSVPEHDAIHAALADWNFALNGYRQYRIESDQYAMEVSVLKRVEYSNQGLIILSLSELAVPEGLGNALAWVNDLGEPVIFVAEERIGQRDLKTIIMHEMGHTLGLSHMTVLGALMNPYYNWQSGCVDRMAVMSLAGQPRHMNWDWRHMNYCNLERK